MRLLLTSITLSIAILCGITFAEEVSPQVKADSSAVQAIPAKADSATVEAVPAKADSTKTDSVSAKTDTLKKDAAPEQKVQKYLHVMTNPFNADIFINNIKPDFAGWPDYNSPAFIKVPDSTPTVLITLFKREFADTTIKVNLSSKDTSYLIVALRQDSDPEHINIQDDQLAHRSRRTIGRNMLFASGVPLLVSAVTAYITHRYIESANDEKSHIQNSIIRSGDNYEQHLKNYRDDRSNAKTAKKIAATALGTGLTLMTIGVILSF